MTRLAFSSASRTALRTLCATHIIFALLVFTLGSEATAQLWPATALEDTERNWSDNTGRFSVLATVTGLTDSDALLRNATGTSIYVPIRRLARENRNHLCSLVAKNGDVTAFSPRLMVETEKEFGFGMTSRTVKARSGRILAFLTYNLPVRGGKATLNPRDVRLVYDDKHSLGLAIMLSGSGAMANMGGGTVEIWTSATQIPVTIMFDIPVAARIFQVRLQGEHETNSTFLGHAAVGEIRRLDVLEQEAALRELRSAKTLLKSGGFERVKDRFETILNDYPDTDPAREAQEILSAKGTRSR